MTVSYFPNISTETAFCGQITVTTAGTAVQGPNVPLTNGAFLIGHPSNTDVTWIWWATGDGRVGYPVSKTIPVPAQVANLNQVWFDATVSGEKICWLKA